MQTDLSFGENTHGQAGTTMLCVLIFSKDRRTTSPRNCWNGQHIEGGIASPISVRLECFWQNGQMSYVTVLRIVSMEKGWPEYSAQVS
jgi:hypothetical protein